MSDLFGMLRTMPVSIVACGLLFVVCRVWCDGKDGLEFGESTLDFQIQGKRNNVIFHQKVNAGEVGRAIGFYFARAFLNVIF